MAAVSKLPAAARHSTPLPAGTPQAPLEGNLARPFRQPQLPFQEPLDALDELARRSRRLADVVEATSRRRDVRDRRAKILLALFKIRCPLRGRPMKAWYVPGAAARVGPEGLQRAWKPLWGEEPPSLRTIRAHLGQLEMACAIARSPGDWLPMMADPEHPERRPRYPDTVHLLESDQAASWWATTGRTRLEQHPEAKYSPATWRRLFERWRVEAAEAAVQGDLFPAPVAQDQDERPAEGPRPRALPRRPKAPSLEALEKAAVLRQACLELTPNPWELHAALAAVGAKLRGRVAWDVGHDPDRLQRAVALLATALRRGDEIRSCAGWLVRAVRYAGRDEGQLALRNIRHWDPRAAGAPPHP